MNKFKDIIKKNLRWIILLLSVIILIEIVENLLQSDIEKFDTAVYSIVSRCISEPLTFIAKGITMIGSVYVILPICIVLIIIFWKKIEAILITTNLGIAVLANQILKRIIARPRPTGYRLIEETGYSFPSGHSMVSMAFYGFLMYLIYKKVKNPYIKWTLFISIGIMIILIGLSRIYLGVHYASDVVAGFCISTAYLAVFTNIISDKIVK